MAGAVFHIVFVMLIAEIIREYFIKDNQKFPIHYIFIAGIGGILPDLDIVVFWIAYFFGFTINDVHRTFTHTIFFSAIFLASSFFTTKIHWKFAGKHHLRLSTILILLSLGILIHLAIDASLSGAIKLLYPFSSFEIGLNLVSFLPYSLSQLVSPCLDAGTFIIFLIWMEYKHKLSRFI